MKRFFFVWIFISFLAYPVYADDLRLFTENLDFILRSFKESVEKLSRDNQELMTQRVSLEQRTAILKEQLRQLKREGAEFDAREGLGPPISPAVRAFNNRRQSLADDKTAFERVIRQYEEEVQEKIYNQELFHHEIITLQKDVADLRKRSIKAGEQTQAAALKEKIQLSETLREYRAEIKDLEKEMKNYAGLLSVANAQKNLLLGQREELSQRMAAKEKDLEQSVQNLEEGYADLSENMQQKTISLNEEIQALGAQRDELRNGMAQFKNQWVQIEQAVSRQRLESAKVIDAFQGEQTRFKKDKQAQMGEAVPEVERRGGKEILDNFTKEQSKIKEELLSRQREKAFCQQDLARLMKQAKTLESKEDKVRQEQEAAMARAMQEEKAKLLQEVRRQGQEQAKIQDSAGAINKKVGLSVKQLEALKIEQAGHYKVMEVQGIKEKDLKDSTKKIEEGYIVLKRRKQTSDCKI